MHPSSLFLAAALVCAALPACKREPEAAPVVAKHRAAIEGRLATLAKIGAALKSVAPLKADKVALDAGPLVLGRTLSVHSSDNAVMQTDAQLADVGASSDFDLGTLGQAARCKDAMKPDSIERWSASVAEEALALCARAKYVVVLRTIEPRRAGQARALSVSPLPRRRARRPSSPARAPCCGATRRPRRGW